MITTKSTRKTLFSVLQMTGALIAFTFRFSKIVLMGRQNFAQATNFMRKIYSVHEDSEDDKSRKGSLDTRSSINSDKTPPKISMIDLDTDP